MDMLENSGRTLAFIGDAVWSLKVRMWLVEHGQGKGDELQRLCISYVSAKAQALFYETMHGEDFFTAEEEDFFHRGRNSHAGSVPHNTPVRLYRISTGFEAMIGALHLQGKDDRIDAIFARAVRIKEG